MYGYITRASDCVVTYDTHTKKQHGLYREIVERIPTDTKLVIIPDAGSDAKSEEWIKMLVNSGYNVLVLDHHEIEGLKDCEGFYKNENVGVIVNNQDGYYENDTLSGVGVVFKFLQVMDSAIPRDNVEAMDFLGLVSLGQVADLMDMRNPETRFLTLSGLKYMVEDSELLNAIVERNAYSIHGNITINSVGWNIAPMLNACFRQGTREDKLDMFEAMVGIGLDREYEYTPKRATKDNPNKETIIETLVPHMVRAMDSLKREQDKQKKDNTKVIVDMIENSSMKDNKIIILDTTGIINPTHTGLTANELAKRYQRPVILLTSYNDEEFGGSGRNYDKFELEDLNQFICDSGLAEAMGKL